MNASLATSAAIDLSRLPEPDILARPDFEARLAAKLARFLALTPQFTALIESDPAMKLLEADAYDELLLAQAMNDAARGMLLAFARGVQLDHLAALFGVSRIELAPANPASGAPAQMESDAELRQRVQLAPHAFSVAGPELAYVFHARSAHPEVLDASAVSPAPGEVVVTILARSDNLVPGPAVLATVEARLGDQVRPLTDHVTVRAAEPVEFAIAADLFVLAGPDTALIRAAAEASLASYLASVRRLGRNVTRSALLAALHVANVVRVELTAPVEDLEIGPGQIARPISIDLTIAGTEL